MSEKIFPKRTKLRDDFPEIVDFQGEFDTWNLALLIARQLKLLAPDLKEPQGILVVPPYKPNAQQSTSNLVLASKIEQITDAANTDLPRLFCRHKLVPTKDVIMMSSKRADADQSVLGWDRPAHAFATKTFEERPEKYVLLLDDVMGSGCTLMALHHACSQAGKIVLGAFANCQLSVSNNFMQLPEQKKFLQRILPEEENRITANNILSRIGLSLETLTSEELRMLSTRIGIESWQADLETIVSRAYDLYKPPLDSLAFLRDYADRLTEISKQELNVKPLSRPR